MKEMKTLKFPNQEEAYEIVDAYAREQLENLPKATAVPDATGDTTTAAEFNALLASLRSAGILAT